MTEWVGDHPIETRGDAEPHLAAIQRFPVKSLDPERPDSATLVHAGALAGDREWAILDLPADEPYDPETADVTGAGDYVNGKKTATVQRLRSTFVPEEAGGPAVEIRRNDEPEDAARRFDLATEGDDIATVHEPLNEWLSEYFDRPVSVRRDDVGHHDDRDHHGPTIISTATLREVASWFDFDVASARRRFRASLEIGGVPPFWEDQLFLDTGRVMAFRIGDATIEGMHPCARCVVPPRDPDTAEPIPDFRETFIRQRRATKPPWTEADRFDHDYRLMTNTRVPEESAGKEVAVGDDVEMLEPRAE